MTFETFKDTINHESPPTELDVYCLALWHDAKGDWTYAHEVVGNLDDSKAAWVHAYLHRKEGDIWNADYWYRRAKRTRPDITLQEEWSNIASALLG